MNECSAAKESSLVRGGWRGGVNGVGGKLGRDGKCWRGGGVEGGCSGTNQQQHAEEELEEKTKVRSI